MCRPSRWGLGLLPLAALFLVALFWRGPRVEADVAQQARAALEAQGVIDPAVAVEGRDARLAGLATGEAAKARETALAAPGVRKVADELKALPVARPYAVNFRRTGDGVTVSGDVPGPAARAALVQAAGALGKVKDETRYAAGAPQNFPALTGAALAALASLSSGEASLSDGALTVVGEAPSLAALETAQAAVSRLPAGASLAKFEVRPPDVSPYAFSARRDGPRLVLSGYAPDAATRGRIADAARRIAPQVEDGLRLAGGAPQGFEAMARAALAALAPLPRAEASLSGASLSMTGEARDAMGFDLARAALAAPPAGMRVARAEIAPPLFSPYPFAATKAGQRIDLTGAVPDEATRARLVAAAAAGGARVEDGLVLARGAGAAFEAQARAALSALAGLDEGEASLADATAKLMGVAPDAARRDAALAALKAAGLTLGTVDVALKSAPVQTAPAPQAAPALPLARPFVFEARKAAGGGVTLSGHAPSESSLALVKASAARLGAVTGVPAPASGLSADINFDRFAEFGLTLLQRVTSGWMRVGDDGLSFGGEAPAGEIEAIRGALRRSGLRLATVELIAPAPAPPPIAVPPVAAPARPVAPEVAACHGRILERLAEETIEFATGSARIAPHSAALIGRLAEVLKGCPQADLEIAGHTDNVGDPARNLILSRERAEAVVKALEAAGAPAARLSAAGYGDARPIAGNDAAEGRARNRRIEFVPK